MIIWVQNAKAEESIDSCGGEPTNIFSDSPEYFDCMQSNIKELNCMTAFDKSFNGSVIYEIPAGIA